jgi:hypothetical protein
VSHFALRTAAASVLGTVDLVAITLRSTPSSDRLLRTWAGPAVAPIMNLLGRFEDEQLMKKFVIATAIAVASLVGALAVWLWERQPWLDPPTVGATATFGESADCLFRYGNAFAGRDQGVRLDNDKVASCFPKQTAAKKKALIACFNTYERNHPNHPGWPEENMRRCTWDGLTAVPAPFGFGKAVAVPAVPRAGRRFVLKSA